MGAGVKLRLTRRLMKHRVYKTISLLDCYRITLAQRPGLMKVVSDSNSNTAQTALLRSFVHPGKLAVSIGTENESLITLCRLGNLSWHAVPCSSIITSLWSTDLIELALHRWLCAHESFPPLATVLLFHLIHINMFVCIPAMQGYVVLYLSEDLRKRPSSAENEKSAAAIFNSSARGKRAAWHAERLLSTASTLQETYNTSIYDTRRSWRPLHYSHSICNASLTLWCHTILDGLDFQAAKVWLSTGLSLLARAEQESRIMVVHRTILEDLVNKTTTCR